MEVYFHDKTKSFINYYVNDEEFSGKVFINDINRKDQSNKYCVYFEICSANNYFSWLLSFQCQLKCFAGEFRATFKNLTVQSRRRKAIIDVE